MAHVIHQLYEADILRWDDYVDRSDSATFFHRAGWNNVLQRAFSSRYLFFVRRGRRSY